jgi:hypothetical protein
MFVVKVCIIVVPVYLESITVKSSLSAVASDIDVNKIKFRDIKSKLIENLKSNQVSRIGNENISISGSEKSATVSVEYEVREPIMGNLDIVMKFEKSEEINL